MSDVDLMGEFIAAVEQAEADAKRLHDEGRCGESEWSCSYCEADQ